MSDYGQPAAANRASDLLKITFAGISRELGFPRPKSCPLMHYRRRLISGVPL